MLCSKSKNKKQDKKDLESDQIKIPVKCQKMALPLDLEVTAKGGGLYVQNAELGGRYMVMNVWTELGGRYVCIC